MKKNLLVISLISVFLMLLSGAVSADVYTTEKAEGYEGCILVTGNHNSFPIEHYVEDTKSFEGVVPDLLKEISEKMNVDFAYINGGDEKPDDSEQINQAQIISVCTSDMGIFNSSEFVKMFSYETVEGVKVVGFLFTENAQKDFVEKFTDTAKQISRVKIDGLLIKHSRETTAVNTVLVMRMVLVLVLFLTIVLLLFLKLKNANKKSTKAKMTDDETGLGNLSYFKYRFENTIDDFSKSLFYVAYIILDISYLRSYYGAERFTDCLHFVAETLTECAGENEFAARISENDFSLVFVGINEESARKKVDELLKKLNDYIEPSEDDKKYVFHASFYNLTKDDKRSEILLFNLRKNCTRIIGTDKQTILCNVQSMNKILEEKKIAEKILRGFEAEEFKLYLQFIVDAKTKKIVSAEALSRWEDKENGILPPAKYIDAMERNGLITKFDFYMFERVVRQLEKWKNTEFSFVPISCNFTRITISEDTFIESIKEILKKYDIDRTKVRIEITEDAIEKNLENALKNIAECKKLGFSIALDDLGNGYTSLANLLDYPIDIVKIDRDILLKTDTDKGKSLFKGIVELSRKLNLKVTCEGVETKEQDTFVTDAGCDYIQGFYHYKPMSEDEYEKVSI